MWLCAALWWSLLQARSNNLPFTQPTPLIHFPWLIVAANHIFPSQTFFHLWALPSQSQKEKTGGSSLNKMDLRLTDGKDKGTINKQIINLGGKALLENGRFMVPIDAVLPLLGRLLSTTIDFHQPARRLFIGNAFTRFTAEFKNGDQPSLVLNFSQPVTRLDINHGERSRRPFHSHR